MFKPVEIENEICFPFYRRNPPLIMYYKLSYETLAEHCAHGTLDKVEPGIVRLIMHCPASHLHVAMHNSDVAAERDTLTLKHPDTNGIIWEVDQDNPLTVVDCHTREPVLSTTFSDFADNDVRIAATAKESIYLLAGIYYRIHTRGQLDTMFDRDLLQQLLSILEKAGVENVQPFEYPYEAE